MTTMTMNKLGPCCSNDNVIIKLLEPSKTSGISEKTVGTFKNLGPTIGTLRLGLWYSAACGTLRLGARGSRSIGQRTIQKTQAPPIKPVHFSL